DLFKDDIIDEMAASALKELANILTGSYIAALADMSGLHIQPTIPFLSVDMAAATLVSGMIDISQETDYALIIDSRILVTRTLHCICMLLILILACISFT